jgi:short subunit dehydrogenase-like uncharacterized protein
MLYSSTGYSGNLIVKPAIQRGLCPILAGRNLAKVERQAMQLGLDYRVFSLDDSPAMTKAITEVDVVLHCAGPFINTFKPMLEACLKAGRNYLDISGEIQPFEMTATCGAEAKERRITIIPGVGMEIVATDCLAAHLSRRLPSATHLALAWVGRGPATFSQGSAKILIEFLARKGRVLRDGRLSGSRFCFPRARA